MYSVFSCTAFSGNSFELLHPWNYIIDRPHKKPLKHNYAVYKYCIRLYKIWILNTKLLLRIIGSYCYRVNQYCVTFFSYRFFVFYQSNLYFYVGLLVEYTVHKMNNQQTRYRFAVLIGLESVIC